MLWILCAGPLLAAPAITQESARIPMRDGIKLAANVFRPSGGSRYPTILVRTPYDKGREISRGHRFYVEHGYAVVVQDVRGKFESDGVFSPLHQEPQDGDDTLNWIARQPWSNAKIGMVGGSYLGIVQWKAALTGNPYLKCIFPVVSGYDDYRDRFYSTGGAMKLGNRLLWMSGNMRAHGFRPPDFNLFVKAVPVKDADREATGHRVAMFQEAVEHPAYDDYWRRISTRERLADVKVPVFSVGGWYDNFVQSDLEAFSTLRGLGRTAHTLIGPWAHNMSIPIETLDFGPDRFAPIQTIQLEWFDHWLKDVPFRTHPAPLRVFVMGINKWRDEQSWPPVRATPVTYYLRSEKGANGVGGDGALALRRGRKKSHDRFVYDPAHPVPTTGGNTCCNPKQFAWGPMDQQQVEKRHDVLVYTSGVLARDIEVTGPVKVNLHVSTTAPDTDFTAKLVDVYPDGRAINLTDGILRLRYREGLDRTTMAEPAKVYAITIDAGVTSNVFKAGHRIRLEISSSNFPRFDRNMNTGRPNSFESKGKVAIQSVHHGHSYSSQLILPVVR